SVTGVSPISGPSAGGTPVAISGVNLLNATSVQFGSVNAAGFTVNSATSITAVAPAGTTTVDVVVVTPQGTSARSADDQYSYTFSNNGYSITLAASTTSPAVGGSATLTGTTPNGATAVRFGAANAASFTVNSATSITATAPAGSAGAIDVFVTGPQGTSAAGAADRFAYVAAPPPAPTVTSVNPNSGPT